MPQHAAGCPSLRPASANQPAKATHADGARLAFPTGRGTMDSLEESACSSVGTAACRCDAAPAWRPSGGSECPAPPGNSDIRWQTVTQPARSGSKRRPQRMFANRRIKLAADQNIQLAGAQPLLLRGRRPVFLTHNLSCTPSEWSLLQPSRQTETVSRSQLPHGSSLSRKHMAYEPRRSTLVVTSIFHAPLCFRCAAPRAYLLASPR